MSTTIAKQGAGFLLADVDFENQATPERLTDEQKMLRETTLKFVTTEIQPRMAELEQLRPEISRELLQKCAALGLCMIDIPEDLGGLGLDFMSSIQVPEILNRGGGFQVAHSVQTVIGMLPILYFGSDELKQRYLPKVATAELVSAYALTEPGSGSDALAAKTTAKLSEDGGQWIINGSKQFISNGGFADIFIVFAQVEGKFSAFVVERGTPGFTVGAEEHKMGIKQSSTTTLAFQDCRIPKNNLIGEIGWGGRIALNVLNVGRLKLGVAAVGGSKEALEVAVKYAGERKQFGQAIANFGLIREKIAEMAARIYAAESTMVRTTGSVNEAVHAAKEGDSSKLATAMMGSLREFNVECAIEKVHGSEALAYVVDEAVQIHGGYGFIEEYPVARFYRDARIARLYEGTNEINRMQIAGDILKRVAGGQLSLDSSVEPNGHGAKFGALADVADQVRRSKAAVARLVALVGKISGGAAAKRGGDQELLARLADIIIAIYGTESGMGRALQARAAGSEHADAFELMTRVYAANAATIILRNVREAVCLLNTGGAHDHEAEAIEGLAQCPAVNVIDLRRKVAGIVIDREGQWFN